MQKYLIKIFGMVIFMMMVSYTANAQDNVFQTEIIVRTVENFKNHDDVVDFISMASENNISIINLNVKEDEDYDEDIYSGCVFYNSDIAPKAYGYSDYDVLEDVIEEAHNNGIQVRAWVPQFHDKAAIDENSDWQMQYLKDDEVVPFEGSNGTEYFVNPINQDVQEYERSIIKEIVSNYDIDGLVLDWVRFDDFNMDMSDYTREKYENDLGYDPITIDFSTDNEQRSQWNDWRTTQIGKYVKHVRNDVEDIVPGLFFGVYTLPPEFVECGQDVKKFEKYVDFVSPMAYFKDWGYKLSWIYDKKSGVLADTKKKASTKEIIPALDSSCTESEYKKIYSGLRKNYPKIKNIAYFYYGRWTDSMLEDIDKRNQ